MKRNDILRLKGLAREKKQSYAHFADTTAEKYRRPYHEDMTVLMEMAMEQLDTKLKECKKERL